MLDPGGFDLDGAVVWSLLSDPDAVRKFSSVDRAAIHFTDGHAGHAYDFILAHAAQHGRVPSADDVARLCRFQPKPTDMASDWILTEVGRRERFRAILLHQQAVQERMTANDPDGAAKLIAEWQNPMLVNDNRVSSLFHHGHKVLATYRETVGGRGGIPYPWQSLNRASMGMHRGRVVVFVARSGVGKSQVGMIFGRHAWKQGFRVLVISPEMPADELAERFMVIDSAIPYGRVIRGELSSYDMERFERTAGQLRDEPGFYVMDQDCDLSFGAIESAIDQVKPHLVIMDAFYALEAKGVKSSDRIDTIVRWMFRMVKRKKVVGLAFSQQNRSAETDDGKGKQSTVALSDSIVWDAHQLYALESSDDDQLAKRLTVRNMKIRRGERLRQGKILVEWDWDRMSFNEIGIPQNPQGQMGV